MEDDGRFMDQQEGYSPIVRELAPLLSDWRNALNNLDRDWGKDVVKVKTTVPKSQHPDLYLYYFHLYALRGVRDFLRIVDKHSSHLKTCQQFK